MLCHPYFKGLQEAENHMVVCIEGEGVAKGVLTDEVMDPSDRGKNSAPADHTSPYTNQMVPSSGIPSSVDTDNSQSRFDIDPRFGDVERDVGPMDELEEVCIDEQDTAKVIKIGKNLEAAVRAQLVEFLRRNLDVFTWPHCWLRPMQRSSQQYHLRRRR